MAAHSQQVTARRSARVVSLRGTVRPHSVDTVAGSGVAVASVRACIVGVAVALSLIVRSGVSCVLAACGVRFRLAVPAAGTEAGAFRLGRAALDTAPVLVSARGPTVVAAGWSLAVRAVGQNRGCSCVPAGLGWFRGQDAVARLLGRGCFAGFENGTGSVLPPLPPDYVEPIPGAFPRGYVPSFEQPAGEPAYVSQVRWRVAELLDADVDVVVRGGRVLLVDVAVDVDGPLRHLAQRDVCEQ